MRCPNCEAQIPDEEKFCPECGVPLGDVKPCPHCGAAFLPGERFCGECGRDVTALETSPTFGPPPPTVPPPAPKKERSPWLWVLVVVAGIALLGCLGVCAAFVIVPALMPTPTPTHTPTPAATATPTATPTPPPPPTPSLQPGLLLYEEDFTEPGAEWETARGDDADFEFDAAAYAIEVRRDHWMAWNNISGEFADFVLEFDAALVKGNMYNSYGVLFRYEDRDNYYQLSINDNNSYTIGKKVDKEWSDLIDWTVNDAIKGTGEVNRIRLIAYGDTFVLYVNAQFVDEFTDSSFLVGDIAPVVSVYDNPPARAKFDNIRVWDVELR